MIEPKLGDVQQRAVEGGVAAQHRGTGGDAGDFLKGLGKEAAGAEMKPVADVLDAHIRGQPQGFGFFHLDNLDVIVDTETSLRFAFPGIGHLRQHVPMTASVQELFRWMHNHEGGQKDHSAIARYYEYLSGIQIGR